MNINRNNYESFFLLYVDNELSAREKADVDAFVLENPDLYSELALLKQSIITGDEIVFEDKQSLVKADGFAALQEKLMLFADGELTIEEQNQVANLLVTDQSAAAEWSILMQTKLHPEHHIVFAGKESLYRRENGRVVGFRWWRAAAAAIFLGFGIWAGVEFLRTGNKPAGTQETVVSEKAIPGQAITRQSKSPAEIIPEKDNSATEVKTIASAQQNKMPRNKENTVSPDEKGIPKKNMVLKENIVLNRQDLNNKYQKKKLPFPVFENINKDDRNNSVVASVPLKTTMEENNIKKTDVAVNKNVNPVEVPKTAGELVKPVASSFAKTAVYRESDETNSGDKVLYMDEDNLKRTRIGGLFHKLKKVIERSTNIKTGNGIKVAGYQIAIN